MSHTPTHCPKCNSLQPFKPRVRFASERGLVQRYATCLMCGHEEDLGMMTREDYSQYVRDVKRSARLRRARMKSRR